MIPLFRVSMNPNAADRVASVLRSGYVGQGQVVEDFEAGLQKALGCAHPPLTVNSGTSSLDLAYHLCGIGPGSEVITTPATCTATIIPLVHRGAKVIYADVDRCTGLIDPVSVADRISSKTKAIVAIDWAGMPCHYDALRVFGVPVIQDAAHAFGATYRDKPIAESGGDYVMWSFQAIKHLTTGDGGAIKTPVDQLERGRLLRWFGYDRRSSESFRCAQTIEEVGYKYQMNDVAAAIGVSNLEIVDQVLRSHQENAAYYSGALDAKKIGWPTFTTASAWWLYTLIMPSEAHRDRFIGFMKQHGIAASPVHSRVDKHPQMQFPSGPLPGVDAFMSREVAIPVHAGLSALDRDKVVSAVMAYEKLI